MSTLSSISLDFLFSVALGVLLFMLGSLLFTGRLRPVFSLALIVLITVTTFGLTTILDVTSGLGFILSVGVLALFTGTFNFFTLPFIFATFAIAFLVFATIWSFVNRTAGLE